MQWLMLQQEHAEDFVIATGRQFSVRDFVNTAAKELGVKLHWQGSGSEEVGSVAEVDQEQLRRIAGNRMGLDCQVKSGDVIVRVDPRYYRPTEVETLLGDATKARKKLHWKPAISFEDMVAEMTREDLTLSMRDAVCKVAGFRTFSHGGE